jgi:hypothetical protein
MLPREKGELSDRERVAVGVRLDFLSALPQNREATMNHPFRQHE